MTTDTLVTLHDVPALRCAPEGPALDGEQAALDLIGDAMGQGAELVVVPAERVAEAFFRLRTGVAGAVVQKFVTYRVRLVVLGDLSRHLADSSALRDFVHETNQGDRIWFLPDDAALAERLAARP
ncbi:DUF4180 domain-containing protein [Streptomyces griseoviridis]|uniref:DUF4180 domain-containing protein n=2 Tax=Streptomyces TaxID=1883 RepID=A0A3S9Z6D9_STRGD|nr:MULTISPECIES: DUF4180 domain-containing protein [Streptomyces]AZS83321.1 DUF4180 domain-containing protein [Streptomyces griseoviridis]MDH6696092.1 hypothetical protein [Streptomyces sp. MAA16]MDT0472251.1 DUF4180 domain-containing protein [Streptomyces sp. DSM 41014]QCN89825.1 DUF4180 domain-containing protein [Streptomyces griseoviridis]